MSNVVSFSLFKNRQFDPSNRLLKFEEPRMPEEATDQKVEQAAYDYTHRPELCGVSSHLAEQLDPSFFDLQQKHIEKKQEQFEKSKAMKRNNIPSPAALAARPMSQAAQSQQKLFDVDSDRPLSEAAKKLSDDERSSFGLTRQSCEVIIVDGPQSQIELETSQLSNAPFSSSPSVTRLQALSRKVAHVISPETMQRAKAAAEKAMQARKIFCIHGPYRCIRKGLRDRGWVEKEFKVRQKKVKCEDDDDGKVTEELASGEDDDDGDDDDSDDYVESEEEEDNNEYYEVLARMVRNADANFMWTCKTDKIEWRVLKNSQIVNHYRCANFTTKVGLYLNLRNLSLYTNNSAVNFFPRCYRLCNMEDKQDFIDDYRLVAARSILKIAVFRARNSNDPDKEEYEINRTGQLPPKRKQNKRKRCRGRKGGTYQIPSNIVTNSYKVCKMFVSRKRHEDIDTHFLTAEVPAAIFEQILFIYDKLVGDGAQFSEIAAENIARFENVLDEIHEIEPQDKIDGLRNTWIVKPGAKSRGRGILVMNKISDILKLASGDANLQKDGRWVVQKYIERPLLIYDTKFDIRQWYLITDWNPLTVWYYDDCYLRFSSRNFDLKRLDNSIHLCNYSVQRHHSLDENRNELLPDQKMWSLKDFVSYLTEKNHEEIWYEKTNPAMKEAVIAACLTAQNTVEFRKSSFELYGADFIIDENFHPWLIEVNASPAMSRSTNVTKRLCKEVQEDVMKVVLDRRRDKNCETGKFTRIFRQQSIDVPLYVGKNFGVEGTLIKKPSHLIKEKSKTKQTKHSSNSSSESKPLKSSKQSKHSSTSPSESSEKRWKQVENGGRELVRCVPVSKYQLVSEPAPDPLTRQLESVQRLARAHEKRNKIQSMYHGVAILDEQKLPTGKHPNPSDKANCKPSQRQERSSKHKTKGDKVLKTIKPKVFSSCSVLSEVSDYSTYPKLNQPPPNYKVLAQKNASLGLSFEQLFALHDPNAQSGNYLNNYLQRTGHSGKSLNASLREKGKLQRTKQFSSAALLKPAGKREGKKVAEKLHDKSQFNRTEGMSFYNKNDSRESCNQFRVQNGLTDYNNSLTLSNTQGLYENRARSFAEAVESSSRNSKCPKADNTDSARKEAAHVLRLQQPLAPNSCNFAIESSCKKPSNYNRIKDAEASFFTAKSSLSIKSVLESGSLVNPSAGHQQHLSYSARVSRKRTPPSMRSLSNRHKHSLRFRLASLQGDF